MSANYDPATARAIREAAEQMELDAAAAEEKDEGQDEDEDTADKDSYSAS